MKLLWDEEKQKFVPPEEFNWPETKRSTLPSPAIWPDIPAYRSPLGTGMIEGRRARREDLLRGNCREVDPSEKPHLEPKTAKQAEAERIQLAQRPKFEMNPQTKERLLKDA